MSRCFPYPPPNYRREEDKPVIESIKLQKEREKAEERKIREEKKREKKEKKEKREKSKDKYENSEHKEHSHKKRKLDERNELHEKNGHQKATVKDAVEQLEKSGLTEENGMPCSTQEPCESSESTQNSTKDRKLEATDAGHAIQGSTILRLKLPLQKYKDAESIPANEKTCFSGWSTSKDLKATPANEETCFSAGDTSRVPEATLANEEPSSSGRSTEVPKEQELCENVHSQSSSRSKSSRRLKEWERQFRDLTLNWNPAPFRLDAADVGDDDQGWLFGNAQQRHDNSGAKSCGVSSICEDLGHGNAASSFQPRAVYLPEFETYQLPYVMPF